MNKIENHVVKTAVEVSRSKARERIFLMSPLGKPREDDVEVVLGLVRGRVALLSSQHIISIEGRTRDSERRHVPTLGDSESCPKTCDGRKLALAGERGNDGVPTSPQ